MKLLLNMILIIIIGSGLIDAGNITNDGQLFSNLKEISDLEEDNDSTLIAKGKHIIWNTLKRVI